MQKGNPPLNTQVENELISFNRKLFNPITTYSLFLKLLQLWPEKKNFSQYTNYALIYRILITFRTKTHYGQLFKIKLLKMHLYF